MSGIAKHHPTETTLLTTSSVVTDKSVLGVYVAISLSGLTALGAEVVWTRLLSLMLGATVYTFSIILAVFLIGLGIGSAVGSALVRRGNARFVLGACQLLLVAAIAWCAWMIAKSLPYWPIQPSLSRGRWFDFQLDLLRCAWGVLPAALLWGASFPAALAAAGGRGGDAGRAVGLVYAANTLGCIVGAIGFSMLAIPMVGSQNAQRILIGIAAVAGVSGIGFRVSGFGWLWRLAPVGAVTALLAYVVPPVPWALIAFGRYTPSRIEEAFPIYVGEGMNASVAVTQRYDGEMCFHVSGKIEASSDPQDMRLQRMLGHIPALIHPNPRSVLVVGCGAGVTAGSFVVHPEVRRIVICEIEPLIPRVVARHFAEENHGVLEDPRVQVVYDDARHYMLTAQEKFDVITSDPIHPWVKGAATLYTREYLAMCKARLNPGGVVAQWVPLYESPVDAVKSEMKTFFEIFPQGTLWSNDAHGSGYDVVLLGQEQATSIDVDALRRRMGRDDHMLVAASLVKVEFHSEFELLARYAGQGADFQAWLKDAPINSDRDLRLQYLAGMGLNLDQNAQIFEQIMACYRFPPHLFVGSRDSMDSLLLELAKAHVRPRH
jgi:spermidine synthase